MRPDLEALKRKHLIVEDGWYSCPKSGECFNENAGTDCDCGADEHNARVEAVIAYIRHLEAAGSAQGVDLELVKAAYLEGAKDFNSGHSGFLDEEEAWDRSMSKARAAIRSAPPSPAPAALRPLIERAHYLITMAIFSEDGCDGNDGLEWIRKAEAEFPYLVRQEIPEDSDLAEPEGTPSETPAPKVLSLQDHKDKKALPIILENIQHLTEQGTPSEKGAV